MLTSELRPRRQITLPAEVCEPAGLKVSDVVEWTFEGGAVVGRKLIKPETDVPVVKPVKRGGKLMLPSKWTREEVRAAVRGGRDRA